MLPLLTTAYLPPIEYFVAVAHSSGATIEQCEYYQKQSYRNRCRIYTPLGAEPLTIPVIKVHSEKMPIRDVRIDYDYPWLQQHERAITSAYNSSAFFEYYKDDLFAILEKKDIFLFDLNTNLLEYLLSAVGIKAEICLSEHFEPITENENDLRSVIHPKYKGESFLSKKNKEKPYYQVFSSLHGFIPNLSIIDLLFAEGPNAISYIL